MTKHPTLDWLPVSSERSLPAVAGLAMVGWVVFELAFRRGLAPALADPLGNATGADMVSVAIGFTLATALIVRFGMSAGVDVDDWEYVVSLRTAGVGVAGGVAVLLVSRAATLAYLALLDAQPPTGAGVAAPAAWVLAAVLAVNGVVVPIVEELAWRGVIQTALTESYGVRLAVVLTAGAFVAKHLVVDAPTLLGATPVVVLSRVTALVVLSTVLCGLRARYGTASSTVAHLVMNLIASVPLLFA